MELGQLLQLLDDWLATGHEQIGTSLARFIGIDGYGVETLRDDFARFMFLRRAAKRRLESEPDLPRKETITNASSAAANVVLVHGGFVDGSGWRPLYDLLTQDGYHVAVVQNPTLSLQGDAAATRLIIDAQDGPVVLVGHSYGGAVISQAGTDPNVAALVYICAFAPDKDESVNTLIGGFPADGPQPPILPPRDGFLFLDRDKFHASFAADLPADLAAFMADSQVPWGVDAPAGQVTDPAWRTKPSWYMVTTEDRMIPPAAQRTMSQRAGSTVVEVAGSHSIYVSQPAAVAALIKQAASAVAARR